MATSLAVAAAAPAGAEQASLLPLAATGGSAAALQPLLDADDGWPDTQPGDQALYLEVVLNQVETGRIVRFLLRDGGFHAQADTLRALGLAWPGSADATGLVPLAAIPGLQASYDIQRQRMALHAPVELLAGPPSRIGYVPPPPPRPDPSSRAPGLLLNYELYGQRGDDYRSASGWNELRLFGAGPGVWSNSMVMRDSSGPGMDHRRESVRLDTYWQLDFPDGMVTVAVGDTLTGALGWTRPTRIGGVRASRDFSLQPYRVTTPLASFAGDAALPSTVDLFINGLRRSSQQVQPGQFMLQTVPSISGTGQAQVVITDINGQQRVVSFDLYGTTQMLQAGLLDWSLEAGAVRRDYGLRSFSYAGEPMASGSLRYGLTDRFTAEAHAQAGDGLQLAGAGGAWLLGLRGGVFNAAAAGSRHRGEDGHLYDLGYRRDSRWFNLALRSTWRSDGYRDLASLEGSMPPLRSDRAFIGFSLPRGQLGTSYVRQEFPERAPYRYASASWTWRMARAGTLNLSYSRDLDDEDGDVAYLRWSMPLGDYRSVSASARRTEPASNAVLTAMRSVPGDSGGWGYRAQAILGDSTGAQAQVTQLGRYGQWTAGASWWDAEDGIDSRTTAYAGASGGLLLMGGRVFAMRRVHDAFAIVSTSGIPGVPVKLENRLVGTTDEHGLLLVSRLNAWQNNKLSIDPLQLPADMHIERTDMQAVPAGRSGMLARFPMRYIQAVQLRLRDAGGGWMAAGSPAWVAPAPPPADAAPDTYVGYDGLVYLQDPPAGSLLYVRQGGAVCAAALPPIVPGRGLVELEELTCR